MISGHGDIETAASAIKRGAYDFIEKPFKADRLLLAAERAFLKFAAQTRGGVMRSPQAASASRLIAGAFWFLTFSSKAVAYDAA